MPRPTRAHLPLAAAALLGGLGLWTLASVGVAVARTTTAGSAAFLVAFGVAAAAPFLLAAYFCLRRQYLNLLMVGAAVLAVLAYGLVASAASRLGLYDPVSWQSSPLQQLLLFLANLALLVAPFYVAGRVYRWCYHVAKSRVPNGQ